MTSASLCAWCCLISQPTRVLVGPPPRCRRRYTWAGHIASTGATFSCSRESGRDGHPAYASRDCVRRRGRGVVPGRELPSHGAAVDDGCVRVPAADLCQCQECVLPEDDASPARRHQWRVSATGRPVECSFCVCRVAPQKGSTLLLLRPIKGAFGQNSYTSQREERTASLRLNGRSPILLGVDVFLGKLLLIVGGRATTELDEVPT